MNKKYLKRFYKDNKFIAFLHLVGAVKIIEEIERCSTHTTYIYRYSIRYWHPVSIFGLLLGYVIAVLKSFYTIFLEGIDEIKESNIYVTSYIESHEKNI